MFDSRLWRQLTSAAAVGGILMVVMLPGLALVRDTTGHDWYAAGKLTLAEALVASGFDRDTQVQYRTREGESETLTRYRMMFQGEALLARSRIVSTALRHAVLGIPTGAALAVFFVALQTYGCWRYGPRDEVQRTRKREPPSGEWGRVASVTGLLMLDGMAPVEVVVLPPSGAGEPARVYGPPVARAGLPSTQGKAAVDAPAKSTRRLPAPAPEGGRTRPGPPRHEGLPNQLPVPSKPKPVSRRVRDQRKPARRKRGKGKLWF